MFLGSVAMPETKMNIYFFWQNIKRTLEMMINKAPPPPTLYLGHFYTNKNALQFLIIHPSYSVLLYFHGLLWSFYKPSYIINIWWLLGSCFIATLINLIYDRSLALNIPVPLCTHCKAWSVLILNLIFLIIDSSIMAAVGSKHWPNQDFPIY